MTIAKQLSHQYQHSFSLCKRRIWNFLREITQTKLWIEFRDQIESTLSTKTQMKWKNINGELTTVIVVRCWDDNDFMRNSLVQIDSSKRNRWKKRRTNKIKILLIFMIVQIVRVPDAWHFHSINYFHFSFPLCVIVICERLCAHLLSLSFDLVVWSFYDCFDDARRFYRLNVCFENLLCLNKQWQWRMISYKFRLKMFARLLSATTW